MSLSAASRTSQGQRPATAGVHGPWLPSVVPEVAAGYWWTAADATGHGTVLFKVPEGGGHTTFDLIQAVVVNQPTVLTESGSVQFRMRKTGDAVGASNLATAGVVQAGWTGPTYLAMWLRLPDAAGIITSSTDTFFQHFLTTGNQRRLVLSTSNSATTTLDRVTAPASVDGISNGTSSTWDTPFDGGAGPAAASWVWYEFVCDPALSLGGSTAADKMKLFFQFLLQTQTIAPSINYTALFDATATIVVCSRPGNLANGDTTDWAVCYYCNGIPSLANREALMRHLAPA